MCYHNSMNMIEINVKSEGQTVSQALGEMEIEIDRCKFAKIPILKVVHGYGSHGVGGVIKVELHKRLRSLKSQGKIKDFIPGEKWIDSNPAKRIAINLCSDLLTRSELNMLNYGVTVIIV